MKNIKSFFRSDHACATAESDDNSMYFGYIGFMKNQDHYGSTCIKLAGAILSKSNIQFNNPALDQRWWFQFSDFSKAKVLERLKKIADSCDKKPEKKSGGFSFI